MSHELVRTMHAKTILSIVAGETTCDPYLLMDDEEFIEQLRQASSIEELVNWVNENY